MLKYIKDKMGWVVTEDIVPVIGQGRTKKEAARDYTTHKNAFGGTLNIPNDPNATATYTVSGK